MHFACEHRTQAITLITHLHAGEKTATEKRHMYVSDEWLRSNPSVTAYMSTSLTLRQQVAEEGIPRLGAEAALDAIKDWGKPASDITHLVVATTSTG